MTDWTSVATVATAIFTAIAAVGAWRSASATRKAAQSQVTLSLLKRYSSEEMRCKLELLGKFLREESKCGKYDPDELQSISNLCRNNLDSARRHLRWFVKDGALMMISGGITSKQFDIAVRNTSGFRLWTDFALPWARDKELHGQEPPSHFDWLDYVLLSRWGRVKKRFTRRVRRWLGCEELAKNPHQNRTKKAPPDSPPAEPTGS